MTKEQYFAQYYGQRVLFLDTKGYYQIFGVTLDHVQDGDDWYLELRSTGQLTDHEYIDVAALLGYENKFSKTDIARRFGISQIRTVIECNCTNGYNTSTIIKLCDYLISIGICLSDEAIENGWAKIKEVERSNR